MAQPDSALVMPGPFGKQGATIPGCRLASAVEKGLGLVRKTRGAELGFAHDNKSTSRAAGQSVQKRSDFSAIGLIASHLKS
jgi:hypothetical protein